jgi:hypothetical protein
MKNLVNLIYSILVISLFAGFEILYAQNNPPQPPAQPFNYAGYPPGAIPASGSNTGTTSGTGAAVAAAVGKFSYLCGFSVGVSNTAGGNVAVTITGVTPNLNYQMQMGTATAISPPLSQVFSPCLPGSALNTQVVVNVGAPGSGGSSVVSAWGYQY